MTHDEHAHPPPGRDPQPTAYSWRGTLALGEDRSAGELEAALDAFLGDLIRFLRDQGCKLIGHIKGIVEVGEEGHLFFSVTSFEEGARFKGELSGGFAQVDFALNVIVYGAAIEEVEEAVLTGLREHVGEVVQEQQVKGVRD